MPTLPDSYFGRPTGMKYVRGSLLPCYYLGIWTNEVGHWMKRADNQQYHIWRPIGNRLSSWKRLEPVVGGRAQMLYDPGHGIRERGIATRSSALDIK